MTFEAEVKVRFSDVDRAGIAYYPTIVGYLHVAFEEFFEEFMGIPYAAVLHDDNIGYPAVNVQAEFKAPLNFGDVVRIAVHVAKIGRTSAHFRYVMRHHGKVHAEATVAVVCVNLDTLTPEAIPDHHREYFERALDPGDDGASS